MKSIIIMLIVSVMLFGATAIIAQDPPEPPKPTRILGEDFFNGYIKMNSEDESEYLKNASAEIKEYFKQIKENDESRYYSLLREYYFSNLRYPMMRKLEADIRTTQKEIIEQEIITEALAAKYRKGKTGNKESIKQELQKSLTQLFDLKESQREVEIKELQNQLKELTERIEVRKKNKATIIKRRMEELLGDDKFLEWE